MQHNALDSRLELIYTILLPILEIRSCFWRGFVQPRA